MARSKNRSAAHTCPRCAALLTLGASHCGLCQLDLTAPIAPVVELVPAAVPVEWVIQPVVEPAAALALPSVPVRADGVTLPDAFDSRARTDASRESAVPSAGSNSITSTVNRVARAAISAFTSGNSRTPFGATNVQRVGVDVRVNSAHGATDEQPVRRATGAAIPAIARI